MILMNDFARTPAEVRRMEEQGVRRVLDSGWFVLGAEVKRFEAEWAAALGVSRCVGVGNGLDAIEIALRALGVGPGDEVITTPMTAFATVLAILRAGATPVLADIDPGTALLDPRSAARCVTARTRALVLVHLYGQARDLDAWRAWTRERGLHLVEDCAQAHLARWQGRPAGSWGEIGAWSFYPTKNLGTAGDGGAISTNDPDLADSSASLRNYGQSERYHHPRLGLNSRLDEIHAAILSARLGSLEAWNQRRRAIAAAYRDGIRNPAVTLLEPPAEPESHVHHLFVVLCQRREALMEHLRERGVQTLIHYPVPVHRQEPCAGLPRDPGGLAAAERHAAACLSIPCHPFLDDAEVDQVVAAVNAFGKESSR